MIAAPEYVSQFGSLADLSGTYRFSIDQYHELTDRAILIEGEPVEMLEGYVVYKLDHIGVLPQSRHFPDWAILRRWTLDEYHRMVEHAILTTDDKVELLDGFLVLKMPQNTPHNSSVMRLTNRMHRLLPKGWSYTIQCPLVVGDSEPEPDCCVIRGSDDDYNTRRPTAADCGLLIEVADSSLGTDRRFKGGLYARAGIATYWIVNVEDRWIEVYTQPTPTGYSTRQDFRRGQTIPLNLDGKHLADLSVDELLP